MSEHLVVRAREPAQAGRALGDDPLEEGLRRLRALSLVVAGLVPLLVALLLVIAPSNAPQRQHFGTSLSIYATGVLLCLAMHAVADGLDALGSIPGWSRDDAATWWAEHSPKRDSLRPPRV